MSFISPYQDVPRSVVRYDYFSLASVHYPVRLESSGLEAQELIEQEYVVVVVAAVAAAAAAVEPVQDLGARMKSLNHFWTWLFHQRWEGKFVVMCGDAWTILRLLPSCWPCLFP